MENQAKTTARDFFLHLGSIVALYAVVIAFLNLLFSVINEAYPQINQYYYSPAISMPVAILIIIFPLFIFLSYMTYKSYEKDPVKKDLSIRKWLTYITLFVAGIVFAGDLVYVVYKFLDGQDFTSGFILKALSVLIVTGFVFGFYLQDMRDKVSGKSHKKWAIVASIAILIAIVLGFSVIGSPRTQRLIRYDNDRVADLQNIQWQIVSYWQRTGAMPTTLAQTNDAISGYIIPTDPETGEPYEYNLLSGQTFELCAKFSLPSNQNTSQAYMYGIEKGQENWAHEEGRTCFERTIDSNLYPVTKPVR